MTTFEFAGLLREAFLEQLRGPGITWNLKGIEHAFDKSVAYVALKNLDEKKEP